MKSFNNDVRERAKASNCKHWQIAEEMGISENTFCRMLRHELPADDKAKIFEIIDRLAKEGGAV